MRAVRLSASRASAGPEEIERSSLGEALRLVDADLVGFVSCRPAPASRVLESPVTFVVGDAYVCPSARRTGIGSALVAAAIARAEKLGATAIEVGTLSKDVRAVAFWKSQGFGHWRVSFRRDLPADVGRLQANGPR